MGEKWTNQNNSILKNHTQSRQNVTCCFEGWGKKVEKGWRGIIRTKSSENLRQSFSAKIVNAL